MEIVLTLLSALCKQLQGMPNQTLLTYFGRVIIMIMVNVRALKGLNMFFTTTNYGDFCYSDWLLQIFTNGQLKASQI